MLSREVAHITGTEMLFCWRLLQTLSTEADTVGTVRTEGRPRVRPNPKQARACEPPQFTARAPAMLQGELLVCARTPGCTKPAGHQGFCSGHKGFKRRNPPKELKERRSALLQIVYFGLCGCTAVKDHLP